MTFGGRRDAGARQWGDAVNGAVMLDNLIKPADLVRLTFDHNFRSYVSDVINTPTHTLHAQDIGDSQFFLSFLFWIW